MSPHRPTRGHVLPTRREGARVVHRVVRGWALRARSGGHPRRMSRTPGPLPAALSCGPFSTREAARAGVTPGRLRASDLSAPHRGVRVRGEPADDLRGRCLAVLPALPEGARFGHVTALGLVGVDPPWSMGSDRRVHVEVSTLGRRPRIRGVVAHRHAGAAPVVDVAGLPVLAPAVAWTRLGAQVGRVELVVLADALCRRRDPVTTPRRLAEAVAALPAGSRGVRRLRAALEDCRAGTDSNMETRARLALSAVGIECDVNRPVLDADGRFVAMPDLSDRRHRVAIDYDGDVHRTDKRTW